MELDTKDLMVVDLEPEMEPGEFVHDASDPIGCVESSEPPTPRRAGCVNTPVSAATEPNGNAGVLIGKLAAWDDAGNPLVDYPNSPSECFLPARTIVPLNQAALGREVALMLIDHDPLQPLIIGLLQPLREAKTSRKGEAFREGEAPAEPSVQSRRPAAEIDGERLVFTADQEIVLQ